MVAVFPTLDVPSLFVASPGDMVDLRRMASKIFEEANHEGGRVASVQIYTYEDAVLENTDAKPIQELICRPDDKLSEGLVAFFGEKVGKDLHSQSEKGMLADLPDLFTGIAASDKRYRLVHPWEEGAEETGGFPLTGSTFEVLCALSGQKRLEAQGSERRLPAFICFASPKEVLDAENDEDAPWGSHRLWDATYEAFKGEKRRLRREQDALSLQRQKLANFARYLTLAGYELRFLSKREEIEEAYRKWIVDNEFAAPSDALEIDPFIGLRSYDVTEHAVYFGREDEVKAVSSIIESIFEKAEAPNCYWVKGASGVGKSSFLRAGLIGELVNSYFSIGRYAYIVFRPNELLSKAALDGLSDPLQAMFSLALEQIYRFFQAETYHPPDFNDYAKTYYDLRPEARGNWVLRTLDYVVAQLQPEGADLPFRLLIGIDQFEEIVDMLFDEARNEQWSSFVDFMTVAPTGQRVFVLSTLRQKRLEKMRKHPGLGPLWERSSRNQYELRLPSRKDFRQIIERSFRLVGHSFPSEDLVNHILSQIDAIQMKEEGRRVGRVMPLLSNALQQLHEQVGEVEWGKANKKNRDGRDRRENREASNEMNLVAAPKASGKKQVKITLELAKQHASLEKAMQYLPSLVAEAMQEYRLNAKLGSQDSTLDDLFRKLVRWTGGREDGDTQFSLPTIQMPSHGDEAVLARALKKQRLLTDEGDGLVRLAHETVLKEWPEAAQFIDRERPLYLLAQEMRADALRWLVRREIDQTKVEEFADIACDMLGLWAQRFHEFFTPQLDPEDIMLRDYCLALMKRVCTPRAVIEKTQFKSTHLHIASLYGRADILREMLERDRDAVNLQRSDDRTAIMTPGFVSDHEVLDTLLAFEADVNSADKDGYVPLHFAAIGGDVAFTRKLIEAGAKIPDVPAHPIHTAAQHDKTDVVSYYLKTHGVGADIRTKMGWTPIMCAAAENKCAALEILADRADLNATIDPDAEKPFGMTALHIAAANGALDFAKALLDQGVPLNQADRGGATALHYAVQHDQPNTVRFLADRMEKAGGDGGNPKAINWWTKEPLHTIIEGLKKDKPETKFLQLADCTPLHLAVGKDDLRCLYALLDAGVKPDTRNRNDQTPLMVAISEGHEKCVNPLAKAADLKLRDGSGTTPLQAAIRKAVFLKSDLTMAMEIASHDPSRKFDYIHMTRVTDAQKLTLLHKAAAEDAAKVTKFLLDTPPRGPLEDAFGRSPLHVAAANGQAEQVALLLAQDQFDVFAPDGKGDTALDLACFAGRYRTAMALIKSVQNRDLHSVCPELLHAAARGGSAKLVQHLVEAGYPADAYDRIGLTPLMIAALNGHEEAYGWLILREDVDPMRPIKDRETVTAAATAVQGGREAIVQKLLEACGVTNLPIKSLVWQAVRFGHFDCAACLLETSELADFEDPDGGGLLSARYLALRERRKTAFPKSLPAPAERLEAILFPKGTPDAADTPPAKPLEPEPGGAAPGRKTTTTPVSAGSGKPIRKSVGAGRGGMTQSRKYGLSCDLYPHLDRRKKLWRAFEGEKRDAFIAKITPVDGKYRLNQGTLSCHQRDLPFYDDMTLICVKDSSLIRSDLSFFYLSRGEELFRLNGTSPPIHQVNKQAPIQLNETNVADYLRFFCFFVRSKEGPFYIIEDHRDPLLPMKEPELRKVAEGTARPVTIDGRSDDGKILTSAVIWYSNAIFIAELAVHATGNIEMLRDEPIAADLPVKLDLPIA